MVWQRMIREINRTSFEEVAGKFCGRRQISFYFSDVKYKSSAYCPNCHNPLPYKAKFCAQCGQKADNGLMSIGNLIKELWFRVLHLESRSLRFIYRLFLPGCVSVDFFQGKKKRYPPPVRFFFIAMFLFLFSFKHLIGGDKKAQFNFGRSGANVSHDTVKQSRPDLVEISNRINEREKLESNLNKLPDTLLTPDVRTAIDSLLRRTYGNPLGDWQRNIVPGSDTLSGETTDTVQLNIVGRSIRVATADFLKLDADFLIAKYHVDDWLNQIFLRQSIRSARDPKGIFNSYLGSTAWTLLALIAFLSGLLFLLYRRQGRYYVEHYIFLLYEHAAILLVLTAVLWLDHYLHFLSWAWPLVLLWPCVDMFLAMRRFYGQSWGWTTGKWLLFFFFYLTGFAVFFLIGLLVVLLIY